MNIHKTIILIVGAWALFFASCSSSDSPSGEADRLVRMPINIAIPVNDASLADRTGAKVTRAEGDPGTYEHFVLPTHLYIYLVVTSMDGTKTTVLTPEGMDVAGGYRLKPENWVKVTTSDYQKDSVYTYTGKIGIIIPEDRSAGVVYAAMSSVPITVSYTGNDVANAGFILGSEAAGNEGEALKNLYSSPYNLLNVDKKYYGTVNDFGTNSPYIDMVLYHVGAKFDMQWNVDTSMQHHVMLRKITLKGLSGGGKLFKPLENTATSAATYSETFTLDAGSQWYGRKATYIIPVKTSDSYAIPMTLTNGAATVATDRDVTATVTPSPTSSTVFVPWMYGKVTVSTAW